MKTTHQIFSFSIFLVLMIITSCTSTQKDFSYKRGGDIWFYNSGIALKFDKNMFCTVINPKTGKNITVEQNGQVNPSHYISINGKLVKNFAVDYEGLETHPVENEFGIGKVLVIKGIAEAENVKIEKKLTIELYKNFPDVAIFSAEYTNLGDTDLTIDDSYSSYFKLDASQDNEGAKPFDFWSFQGSSLAWGFDYVIQIKDGFEQGNWMGVQPETKTGGGIPIVDLWNQQKGLAIAHIATVPQLVSFPVKVEDDKKVSMGLVDKRNKILTPQESFKTLKTAVINHKLDYFDALKTYSSLMADQGIKKDTPSEESHDAVWCGWGYLTDFTLDDIYGTLPKLKEMGLKWVVIDDRWWDKYGDWNIRDYTFPKGEKQIKEFVDSLHNQGFLVKIWWAPTPVQPEIIPSWGGSVDPGAAQVVKNNPEWLIMDENGDYPRDCRDMYQLCPSVPEVQEYMKTLTTRFIKDWGFDGHKLDAYYVVPPCYNPAHHHKYPEESYQDLPKMLQAIYETSKSIKPYSVTEICNCGTTQDFFQSIFTDQPVTSDPTSVEQQRRRVKTIKALWGPNAPAYTDHVEHIRLEVDMNDKSDTAKVGQDFATSIGCGGVPGTKFTWPAGPQNMQLSCEREKHWQKWLGLFNEKQLSKGTYLNLYDIIYDKPESHVIRKGESLYYAFYGKEWDGDIELRGLDAKEYKVHDYVNDVDLGKVIGPKATINASYKDHLLIECIPVE